MKSSIKTFTYVKTNKNGTVETKTRNVFVMEENDNYIRGYDVDVLGDTLKTKLLTKYADHEVSSTVAMPKGRKAGAEKRTPGEFDAGIRLFKKSNIQ